MTATTSLNHTIGYWLSSLTRNGPNFFYFNDLAWQETDFTFLILRRYMTIDRPRYKFPLQISFHDLIPSILSLLQILIWNGWEESSSTSGVCIYIIGNLRFWVREVRVLSPGSSEPRSCRCESKIEIYGQIVGKVFEGLETLEQVALIFVYWNPNGPMDVSNCQTT